MIRLQIVYTGLPGLPGVSTLFFTGDSQSIADDAALKVEQFMIEIGPSLTGDLVLSQNGTAVGVNEETGEQFAFYAVDDFSVFGSNGQQPVPNGAQINTRLDTSGVVNSRRVQGHIYTPGVAQGAASDGSVDPVVQSNFDAAVTSTLLATEGSAQLCVWSRPKPATSTPARVGSSYTVDSATVAGEFAFLRSRRD